MENNNDSSTNTVLIVIILLVLVGALVWFLAQGGTGLPTGEQNDDPGVNLEVTLPGGANGGEGEAGGGE